MIRDETAAGRIGLTASFGDYDLCPAGVFQGITEEDYFTYSRLEL